MSSGPRLPLSVISDTDTPWDERRRDVTIWLRSHITSGDQALAPMALTTTAARRCTDQAINSYTTLRRRAVPALENLVNDYAKELMESIDTRQAARVI